MPSSKARLVANLASGSTFANAIIDNVNANTFAAKFPALGGDLQNTEGSNTVTLVTSGVTAGTYGNTTAIPVITVDAKGRITSATTNGVSGVTGVSYTAANSTITVSTSTVAFSANIQTANSSVQGLIQVVDSVANLSTTVAASANSVKNAYDRAIDANTRAASAQTEATSAYSNAVTYAGTIAATAYSNAVSTASADATTKAATAYTNAVAYAASNTYVNTTFAPKAGPTFTGTAAFADVTISGNLTTSGTTTYINTTNLTVGDNVITLNADLGASAPTENAGIEVNRGTSANVALRWNETLDKWETTVDGTNYLTVATNTDVSTAYSNAIAYSGNAALAYANAVSVAATDASTKAATAYSNATTYAATIAGTAYSNAIAYAAANSYVNTQLALKANLSGATFSGAVSGITTLAAGNTTITGFANVSSTLQVTGGSTLTGAVTMANTLAVTGTSTFTGLITGTVTSANNADYLDGQHGAYYAANSQLASYQTTAGLSANVATLTSNNANYLGGVAASSYARISNTAPKITSSVAGVNNSTWTTICNVDGNGDLGSTIRAVFSGTSDSVVVNVIADIVVNHSLDIAITTLSGFYTQLQLRLITNGNENYTLQVKHNGSTATALRFDLYPLGGESITLSPGTLYSSYTFDHVCYFGTAHSGTGGYAHNIRTDGTLTAGNTSITGFITSDASGAGGLVRVQSGGSTIGGIAGSGNWLGTAATDLAMYAETGKIIQFFTNGSASVKSYIDTSGHFLPGADATYNLGSTTYRWNNIYTADAHFSNEGTEGNSVDGTTGNWTLQEGEDFIYMLNNKTGKRYKIKMEEV